MNKRTQLLRSIEYHLKKQKNMSRLWKFVFCVWHQFLSTGISGFYVVVVASMIYPSKQLVLHRHAIRYPHINFKKEKKKLSRLGSLGLDLTGHKEAEGEKQLWSILRESPLTAKKQPKSFFVLNGRSSRCPTTFFGYVGKCRAVRKPPEKQWRRKWKL